MAEPCSALVIYSLEISKWMNKGQFRVGFESTEKLISGLWRWLLGKALALQSWGAEFDPQKPHDSEKLERKDLQRQHSSEDMRWRALGSTQAAILECPGTIEEKCRLKPGRKWGLTLIVLCPPHVCYDTYLPIVTYKQTGTHLPLPHTHKHTYMKNKEKERRKKKG